MRHRDFFPDLFYTANTEHGEPSSQQNCRQRHRRSPSSFICTDCRELSAAPRYTHCQCLGSDCCAAVVAGKFVRQPPKKIAFFLAFFYIEEEYALFGDRYSHFCLLPVGVEEKKGDARLFERQKKKTTLQAFFLTERTSFSFLKRPPPLASWLFFLNKTAFPFSLFSTITITNGPPATPTSPTYQHSTDRRQPNQWNTLVTGRLPSFLAYNSCTHSCGWLLLMLLLLRKTFSLSSRSCPQLSAASATSVEYNCIVWWTTSKPGFWLITTGWFSVAVRSWPLLLMGIAQCTQSSQIWFWFLLLQYLYTGKLGFFAI